MAIVISNAVVPTAVSIVAFFICPSSHTARSLFLYFETLAETD